MFFCQKNVFNFSLEKKEDKRVFSRTNFLLMDFPNSLLSLLPKPQIKKFKKGLEVGSMEVVKIHSKLIPYNLIIYKHLN